MAKEMKGHKGHHHRRKAGGKAKGEQEYNAQGSHEMHEAEEKDDGFKKGGAAKKKRDHEKLKHGGHAEGMKAKERADRKPHRRKDGGRSPYSAGHHTTTMPEAGKTDSGHEGQRPDG